MILNRGDSRTSITTRYHGPTNTKGSRVSAFSLTDRITIDWDDACNSEENHTRAAEALMERNGWNTLDWVIGGGADNRGYTFVIYPLTSR
jgi:hypothetical protein